MGIPYETIMLLIDDYAGKPGYNCVIFSFETPDGYWSINWTAPRKILEREDKERDIFLRFIKFMGIGIMRSEKAIEIHM